MSEFDNIEFDIPAEINFTRNRRLREDYEESDLSRKDIQAEAARKRVAPLLEEESQKIVNEEPDSILSTIGDTGKHIAIGAAEGVEETLSAARIIEDEAFNLPKPEGIRQSLAQGLGQVATTIVPAIGAVGKGMKLFNILSKSKKLTAAGHALAGATGGAIGDFVGFDPKDPNFVDFLFTLGVVSENSPVGAALKKHLAQNDDDSELKARSKNALTGLMAAAAVDTLLRGSGAAIRSVKTATKEAAPVVEKEAFKAAAKEEFKDDAELVLEKSADEEVDTLTREEENGVEDLVTDDGISIKKLEQELKDGPISDFVDLVDKAKEVDPSKAEELRTKLPGEIAAEIDAIDRASNDFMPIWEKLDAKKKQEVHDIFQRWANGEKIVDADLDEIISMNFGKLDTDKDVAHLLQFVSRTMSVDELVKTKVGKSISDVEGFDIQSGIEQFFDLPPSEWSAKIAQQTGNIREAIRFVGAARALAAMSVKQASRLAKRFTKSRSKEDYDAFIKQNELSANLLGAGGEFTKAASDLLRSHAKNISKIENVDEFRFFVRDEVMKGDAELQTTLAQQHSKLGELDEIQGVARVGEEIPKKFKVKTEKVVKEAIDSTTKAIKNLKRQLSRLKKQESEGFPPDKAKEPVKDTPEITKLKEEIKLLKDKKKAIRDRDKLSKEQLQVRRDFERLSKKLSDLQAGKSNKPQGKSDKVVTQEITDLKVQIKALRKKLKPASKAEKNIARKEKRLTDDLNKLLVARKSTDIRPNPLLPKPDKQQITSPKIKELEKSIEEQRGRLGLLKSGDATIDDIREFLELEIKGDEALRLETESLSQLKGRLNARHRSFLARTKDALLETYVNGLLSSAKTFQINGLGNTSAMVTSVFERVYAGVRHGITGEGEITFKEAMHLIQGYMGAKKDFWRLVKNAFTLEAKGDIKQDFIRPHDRAITKENFKASGVAGKAVDLVGSIVNFPGRLLLSADEVFKAINYRAEVRALAYRKARKIVGDTRTTADKIALQKEFDKIMQNPELYEDVIEGATGFAAQNTFTNKLANKTVTDVFGNTKEVPGLAKKLKGILDSDPTGISRVFIPFFQTPANLFGFAGQRLPLPTGVLRKISNTLENELSHPDAAVRELAEAKVATARVMWLTMFGFGLSGNLTGPPPADSALRKTLEAAMGGAHWHSIQNPVTGGWIQYNRLDPLGVMMSASAILSTLGKSSMNLMNMYQKGDPSDEIHRKFEELVDTGTVGLTHLITDRHYLKGFSEVVDFLMGGDKLTFQNIIRSQSSKRVAGALNPGVSFYSSFRRGLTRGLQPQKLEKLQRTDFNMLSLNDWAKELSVLFEEGLRDTTPGYGKLRPSRNLIGENVLFPGTNEEIDTQPYRVLKNLAQSSLNISPDPQPSKSPLIQKLAQLEMTIEQPSGLNKIGATVMTDDEKEFYIDQWTNLNKTILEPLVKTKSFNQLPEGFQRELLEMQIQGHKEKARKMTIIKFSRLSQSLIQEKQFEFQSKIQKQVPTGFQNAIINGGAQ
jgi:hypothetical protein